MTLAEHAVLSIIGEFVASHGHAPTIREIAERRGITSLGSAHALVEGLIRAGALERVGKGRGSSLHLTASRKLVLELGSLQRALDRAAARDDVTPEEFALRALRDALFPGDSVRRETRAAAS